MTRDKLDSMGDFGIDPRVGELFPNQIKDCISGLDTYLPKINIQCENIEHHLIIPKFDNKIYFSISDTQAKKLFQVIINYGEPK